jgi:putative copper export protein
LFLHILAAAIWVGGQVIVAAVVPIVRRIGGVDATRAVGRQFQLIAWPAFAALVVTGVWNLVDVHVGDASSEYLTTLAVKLAFVLVSGLAALGHMLIARTQPVAGGVLAGLSLLSALAATFLGVLLRT